MNILQQREYIQVVSAEEGRNSENKAEEILDKVGRLACLFSRNYNCENPVKLEFLNELLCQTCHSCPNEGTDAKNRIVGCPLFMR